MLLCPSIELTDWIETPLDKVIVVAKVCLAKNNYQNDIAEAKKKRLLQNQSIECCHSK